MWHLKIIILFLFFCSSASAQSINGVPNQVLADSSGNPLVSTQSVNVLPMANGANVAHTVYTATSTQSISGTTATSIFANGGVGNQTVTSSNFYRGAQFEFKDAGIASTGTLNVAAATITIYFGSTAVATVTTATLPVNISTIPYFSDVICTMTSSTSVICFGYVMMANGLINVAPAYTFLNNSTPVTVGSGSQKLDSTVAFTSLTGAPSLTVSTASIVQNN